MDIGFELFQYDISIFFKYLFVNTVLLICLNLFYNVYKYNLFYNIFKCEEDLDS
jgi:hypothetical protein